MADEPFREFFRAAEGEQVSAGHHVRLDAEAFVRDGALEVQREEAVIELGRWGSRTSLKAGAELSVDALMVALKTTFVPGPDFDCELRFGDDVFHVIAVDGRLSLGRGAGERPGLVAEMDAKTLRGLVFGGRPVKAAMDDGDLRLQGERAVFERFASCFPRPAPL